MTTPSVPHLAGARDPRTGDLYVPQRQWSVDGSLTALEPAPVVGKGVLAEVIDMGPRRFGYVDLPGSVRMITELGAGPHEVGAHYVLVADAQPRRFDRA